MDGKPVFCNGGDRTRKNIPEVKVCTRLNIKMIFGMGKKRHSSSHLVKIAKKRRKNAGKH